MRQDRYSPIRSLLCFEQKERLRAHNYPCPASQQFGVLQYLWIVIVVREMMKSNHLAVCMITACSGTVQSGDLPRLAECRGLSNYLSIRITHGQQCDQSTSLTSNCPPHRETSQCSSHELDHHHSDCPAAISESPLLVDGGIN
jgi:hypothetical protein